MALVNSPSPTFGRMNGMLDEANVSLDELRYFEKKKLLLIVSSKSVYASQLWLPPKFTSTNSAHHCVCAQQYAVLSSSAHIIIIITSIEHHWKAFCTLYYHETWVASTTAPMENVVKASPLNSVMNSFVWQSPWSDKVAKIQWSAIWIGYALMHKQNTKLIVNTIAPCQTRWLRRERIDTHIFMNIVITESVCIRRLLCCCNCFCYYYSVNTLVWHFVDLRVNRSNKQQPNAFSTARGMGNFQNKVFTRPLALLLLLLHCGSRERRTEKQFKWSH